MQSSQEIEESYINPDPWGYQTRDDDMNRKLKVINACNWFMPRSKGGKYNRALDIGCGEGWITKDLPSMAKYGYELSNNAASRFPQNVIRETNPSGKYDLIVATGVMYGHYDWQRFIEIIQNHASGIVVLSNIKAWEVPGLDVLRDKQIHEEEFKYCEFVQKLRVYDFTSQHRPEDQQ